MPATASFTPTAEFVTGSVLTLADGDPGDAVSLNAAPKSALNQAAYLRDATDGLLVWRGNARVDSGGASSGNTAVYCPPIEAVSLLDGSTWRALSLASETQLTTASHFGGETLAATTWYYVYAYVSGGNLALQISADAPGADGIWKTGAVSTHRFLFCFRTNGSGVAIPMCRTSGGRYHWRFSALSSAHLINAYMAVQAFTDLSLAACVPPHARIARLRATILNTDTTASHSIALRVRTNGDTIAYDELYVPPAATAGVENAGRGTSDLSVETDSSQVIEVEIAGTSTAFSANVYARGFEE